MKLKIPISEILIISSSISSILFSLYLYFVENNPHAAIFVGLWAPTILAIVNYINIKFDK